MRNPSAATVTTSALLRRADRLIEARSVSSDGTELLDLLRDDGFLYAPLPLELGGSGDDSSTDLVAACARLAQHDPATASTVGMHFVVLLSGMRSHDRARRRGQSRRAELIARQLGRAAWSGSVFAADIAEPDDRSTTTRARLTADGEAWVIDGEARFRGALDGVTNLSVGVRFVDDDGVDRFGFADVPVRASGVERLGPTGDVHRVGLRSVRLPIGSDPTVSPVGHPSAEVHDRVLLSGRFVDGLLDGVVFRPGR